MTAGSQIDVTVVRSLRAAAYAESVALRELARFELRRRLPLGPLEEVLRAEWVGVSTMMQTYGFGPSEMANRLHVPVAAIYRWRQAGLTLARADQLAMLLDLHPALIWSDLWFSDVDLDELDDLADIVRVGAA